MWTQLLKTGVAGVALLVSASVGANPTIPSALPAVALPHSADLVDWPLDGYPVFAKDSIGNLQNWLLDAPAGKHGHVTTRQDGQLEFEDGTPASFWGTTTVYGTTFPEKRSEVVLLADAIASRGYNLVRFHHNDIARNGLGFLRESPKSNYKLDPKGMDRLDFFAAELIKRGVYIYVDLIDYRSFKAEDGFDDHAALNKLGNHGWKGVFPHPTIVAAWKRFATEFLSHKNPYTGKTWAEDPAMATVEIINENGQFWDWGFVVTPTIRKWHDQQWNRWLLDKYGTRAALDAAWTDGEGTKGLFQNEDPAKGTVFRPRLGKINDWDRSYRSKTSGAARINDYYRHLSETSIAFYKQAKQHLDSLGFKGVVVGSHELRGPLNRYAEFQGTGAVAAHLYGPSFISWKARPGSSGITVDGVDVKANNWFSNMQRIKVQGAPAINGEWTAGGLTHRADSHLAIAAASAFQRVTQSAHFSYGHRWRGEEMPDYDDTYVYRNHLGRIARSFSSHHDIPWMMVNRICAPMFVRRDFAAPKHTVHIAYSTSDLYEQNLHALGMNGGSGTIGGASNFLPILHNLECVFFDQVYEGDADVVFMTGRSSSGDYSQAKHAVLVGDNPFADPQHKTRDIGRPARNVNPDVNVVTLDSPVTFTCGWPWETERKLTFASLEGAIEIDSIPAGAQAIGKSSDGHYTLGWLDDRFLVLPNGRAFQTAAKDAQWLYRLYLAACKRWNISTGDNRVDSHVLSSDTGEFTVDWGFGTLQIDTAKTQGFSGLAGWRPENKTSALECRVQNPYANVLATSTDNAPLSASKKILLVAVGRMENAGAALWKDKHGKDAVSIVGCAPTMVEALRGEVTLKHEQAEKLTVYALDPAGNRRGVVASSVSRPGHLSFALSPKWQTIWFELSVSNTGTANRDTSWTQTEKPAPSYPKPALIPLADYFKKINLLSDAPQAAAIKAYSKLVLKKFTGAKDCHRYGNTRISTGTDAAKGRVLAAQYGKVTQEWYGGIWWSVRQPAKPLSKKVAGFGLTFKGDGTRPRDTFLNLSTSDGGKYRSQNLNTMFEDDSWNEIVLSPGEFRLDPSLAKKNPQKAASLAKVPDLSTVTRCDLTCVGPLMNQQSNAMLAEVFLAIKKPAVAQAVNPFKVKLPAPGKPASKKVQIPFVPRGSVKADGVIDEAVWTRAVAVTMDEEEVPDWHFFGSHIVTGQRERDQKAQFWLLASGDGLAFLANVTTGNRDVTAEEPDWWKNDCVELFSDVDDKGGKPSKQIFLSYKRSGQDRAASSDAKVKIARAKLKDGYVLEALIPWHSLGFQGLPLEEFGVEFQVDFARPGDGRVLQMCYGTGTNEAWMKSDQYLRAQIRVSQ
jgi:hypothetical protein